MVSLAPDCALLATIPAAVTSLPQPSSWRNASALTYELSTVGAAVLQVPVLAGTTSQILPPWDGRPSSESPPENWMIQCGEPPAYALVANVGALAGAAVGGLTTAI